MDQSFETCGEFDSLADDHAQGDYRATCAAPAVSGPAHLLTESDYQNLDDRSRLGTGLANITSRLVRQLANGGDPATGRARAGQRDTRGSLVPWDDSPLVGWQRVVAVSRGGSMLVMVSLPISTRLGIAGPSLSTPRPGTA